MTTTFHNRFEKSWNRLLKRHSTEIILVGVKANIMKEAPQYIFNGTFSGWTNTDNKKDIFGETNTVIKLKTSDFQNTYSQPNIIKGNGRIINSFCFEKIEEKILYSETELNQSYTIVISVKNNIKTKLKIYNEEHNLYTQITLTKDTNNMSIPIVSNGNKLYIDYSESVGEVLCEATLNMLDESVKCELTNLKSDIDFVKVGNRTFKIDSQTLSGSGNLVILTVSNKG